MKRIITISAISLMICVPVFAMRPPLRITRIQNNAEEPAEVLWQVGADQYKRSSVLQHADHIAKTINSMDDYHRDYCRPIELITQKALIITLAGACRLFQYQPSGAFSFACHPGKHIIVPGLRGDEVQVFIDKDNSVDAFVQLPVRFGCESRFYPSRYVTPYFYPEHEPLTPEQAFDNVDPRQSGLMEEALLKCWAPDKNSQISEYAAAVCRVLKAAALHYEDASQRAVALKHDDLKDAYRVSLCAFDKVASESEEIRRRFKEMPK